MRPNITIAIAARDAEPTIARAVRSACAEDCHVLLIDHASTDGTASIARQAAAGGIEIVQAPAEWTLGAVRGLAVRTIRTDFGVWLDADDELLPGRCAEMVARLHDDGADLAYDEIELCDGGTGAFLRSLTFPEFLRDSRDMVRNFERNFVPGPGVPGFRADFARRVGYDPGLHGAEDYDFLLRSVAAGGRFSLMRRRLYRQFAYPESQSRNLDRQRSMCRRALMKHDPVWLEDQLRRSGVDGSGLTWTMISFLVFREEHEAALHRLNAFGAQVSDVRDRDDFERWRHLFMCGTLELALGRMQEARRDLAAAQAMFATPEGANNLGVAFSRCGARHEADALWKSALAMFPDYRDASENLGADQPTQVTMLPLRRHAARSRYA